MKIINIDAPKEYVKLNKKKKNLRKNIFSHQSRYYREEEMVVVIRMNIFARQQ